MRTVLFVEPVGERGGAQVLGLTLMQGLCDRGWRVVLAALAPGPLADEARDRGIETVTFPRHRTRNLPATALTIARLARLARRIDADLLHAQGTKTLIHAGPAGRLAGARVLWQVYDPPPDPPSWIDRVAIRMPFDCVVAIVPGTAGAFARLLRDRPVPVVLPGIPAPTRPGPADQSPIGPVDEPLILSVGRLQAFKGYDVLAAAAAQVLARRPDARFSIVGATQFGLEPELPSLLIATARRLGIADRFVLAGSLTDTEVYTLMGRAAMLVHPALREPFGLVLLEAMAHALPVVATRTEGASLIVEPGRTGLLVPPGDAARLASAILELLDDPSRAAQMGVAGRERFKEKFTATRMIDAIEALYASMLAPDAVQ